MGTTTEAGWLGWPAWVARRIRPMVLALAAACIASGLAAGDGRAAPGRTAQLVVLGDSLSAGYLLPDSEAFPAVLQAALRERGHDVVVVNAAVSGDTTARGLARLDRDVPDDADGVILELGANDRILGIDPATTRATLDEIVGRLRARRIPVLLAGIRFRESDWKSGREVFNAVFPEVARRNRLAYYPDFYAGLLDDRSLRIFDGVHPSGAGVRRIVAGILPTVERFLASLGRRSAGLPGREAGTRVERTRNARGRSPAD